MQLELKHKAETLSSGRKKLNKILGFIDSCISYVLFVPLAAHGGSPPLGGEKFGKVLGFSPGLF